MSLPDEIAEFGKQIRDSIKEAPKKTTTASTKHRKHNHFPQGKTGFVPRGCSNPVNIRIAKRR